MDHNDLNQAARILEQTIAYAPGAVVSKTILKRPAGTITLFAFDKGEGLSEHSTPHDAFVQVLDGQAEITIGGTPHLLSTGQGIIMPAQVPHALRAVEPFKMLLVMLKNL